METVSMRFNEPKDFGYLLLHPNALEVMTKLITSSQVVKGKDYGDSVLPDFFANCDFGFCQVSFDRKSEVTRYRVKSGDTQKDFEDLAEVVACILSRWY